MNSELFNKINKLDYELRLSFTTETSISELSQKFSINAFTGIRIGEKKVEFTYFFPEDTSQSREIGVFLRQFDAIKNEGVWRVKVEDDSSANYVVMIRDMLSVSSAAMTGIWLINGKYHVGFVFHHSELPAITGIIHGNRKSVAGFSIDYLGKSEGFAKIVAGINDRIKLNVAYVELVAPEEELSEINNPMRNHWIRVLKTPYGSEKVQGIFIPSETPTKKHGIHTIVDGELYSATTGNSYLKFMNSKKNSERVVTMWSFQKFDDGILTIVEIIPSAMTAEWMRIFSESVKAASGWKPSLSYFSDFSEWIDKNTDGKGNGKEGISGASHRVPRHSALVKIDNIMPSVLQFNHLRGKTSRQRLLLLSNENGKWMLSQNLGPTATDLEYTSARKHFSNWKGDLVINEKSGIIRAEVPGFLQKFLDSVYSVRGAMIIPAVLQSSEDLYLSIEFHTSELMEISRLIGEFLTLELQYRREIAYLGEGFCGFPRIYSIYEKLGNDLNDLTLIRTVWNTTKEEIEKEVHGIFQNGGVFIPKMLADRRKNPMVARLYKPEIKGSAAHTIVDGKTNVVEFDVDSSFFPDFYSETISSFYSPVFFSMKVEEGQICNYYLIEREMKQEFIQGLSRHWKHRQRENHSNHLAEIVGFKDWISGNSMPF